MEKEFRELAEQLKQFPERNVAHIRKEILWMADMIRDKKVVASEVVLASFKDEFRHRLQKLGILV